MIRKNRLPVNHKGFLYREENNSLIINSTDFNRAIKVIKQDNIKNLEINPNFFKEQDLNFLRDFIFIEGLSVLGEDIIDMTPIQLLSNLKILIMDNKLKGYLNFRAFKDLEECFFVWGIQDSATIFETFSLTRLRIDSYDKFEIFEIQNLENLISLSLYYSKIINLNGICNLNKLLNLDLTSCNYLEDITKITHLKALNTLRIDNCKRLKNVEPIGDLKQLKSLSFNDVGNLASLNFLERLNNLEEIFFTGSTKIEDGNLNVLNNLVQNGNLRKVIFKNRKNYSHRVEDFGYKVPTVVANIFRK